MYVYFLEYISGGTLRKLLKNKVSLLQTIANFNTELLTNELHPVRRFRTNSPNLAAF